MSKAKHIPRALLKTITEGGKKVWQHEIAKTIKPPLLNYYALACNSLALYNHVTQRLADMEAKGEDTFVTHNNNGTVGKHPLRLLQNDYRKAYTDNARHCGLTVDQLESGTPADDDWDDEDE